ncbi:MAG: O-methyltransferase [Paludibacteraceae bacterium]|nr:O-methyltransferase [Paludibacteraceae bacterium]
MENIEEYIEHHSSPESDLLTTINRKTHLEVLNPRMLSGHIEGRFLSMISHMIRPRRVLELGTYTGYSALCLAEGLTEDGKLISIEKNDELEDIIRENIAQSPLGQKIEVLIGDCKELIPGLKEMFDVVFIDADKREYSEYLDAVLPFVRKGGWIIADNTLWDGHVVDANYDHDKQTIGLRAFNDKVRADERLENVMLPLRDGVTLIHVVS